VAIIASIAPISLPAGTRQFIGNVPVGLTLVQFAVIRSSLVPSPTLNINWQIAISLDGGANFGDICAGGNNGDNLDVTECNQSFGLLRIQRDADGLILVGASAIPVGWSIVPGWEASNPNRQLRAILTLNEGAILGAELRVT